MKKNLFYTSSVPFFILISVIFLSSCSSNEWPNFRGSDSSMVLQGKDLPTEWNDSLNVSWTYPMEGESWSSPIISGDRVFFTSVLLVKKAPQKESENTNSSQPDENNSSREQEDKSYLEDVYRWQITCLDLNTGKELWKEVSFEGNPEIKKHARNNYACETPVTDGKRLYVYYGMVGVYCYDMNGKLAWEKDLGAYETLNGWGTGASPVLDDDILFVKVDNEENSFISALNAGTGEEVWRVARDEKTTYSTPVIWENKLRKELVTTGNTVCSYDPESGELLWEMKIGKGMAIPSPVYDKEYIYFGNSGGSREVGGLFAVKAGAEGDITPKAGEFTSEGVVWSDTLAGTGNPSPVIYEDLIYVLGSRGGEINCFEASSGERVYKEKIEKLAACWATPWVYNGQLYFYDERGNTHVIKTGRKFELIKTQSINDKFWASIAASKDAYIFKGVENIYCVRE